ncbi:membrane protein insertase YidC [Eubacteriales bacterium OttesenSCG-928-N14]|nr:membrane protein insertase YidC [Eubacteriales bacterium OttesenSCG-928-N14]
MINTIIGTPLGYLMWLCLLLLGNYGVAIIVFTLLTKVILFPLSIWVQKNSIKMIKLQPAINQIAARFAGDKDKVAEEQMALYKQESYRPLAGVIPMLIQIPIILGLISVIYNPLQHLLHLDAGIISAFSAQATAFVGQELGSGAQLKVIELIQDPRTVDLFLSLPVDGGAAAVASIQGLDLHFLGLNLSHVPSLLDMDVYTLFPVFSGLSALLLCILQNRENVLQREQGWLGKWGTTIFLTAFSTYFAALVPAGVGLYWIAGNLFSIVVLYLLNWMYNPKKFIDYEALEESKRVLAESKKLEQAAKATPEQKQRAKEDYKRFFKDDQHLQLLYYSEKSGFYKYFQDQIDYVLERSEDITIHYVTSDPNDAIFDMDNPRLIPYYIDDNRLIPLFMKVDADVFVMTTPSLQTYHLKRSLVNKNVEYIYTPHDPISVHMAGELGALNHFDTVICVGPRQYEEIRATERVYNLPEKNLVKGGYTIIDDLIANYEAMDKTPSAKPRILIAPSWQDGNILEDAIFAIVDGLLPHGYDITIRPHPEFVKRYAARMQQIIDYYADKVGNDFRIETDFSSSTSIFSSDVLITDWSGIAFEFSYATKKPTLFINTPMKVMNPEYDKIDCVPVEVELRDKIGISIDLDALSTVPAAVQNMLELKEDYSERIDAIMHEYLYNVGHTKEAVGGYVLEAVNRKRVDK